jgi:hypothetical protein
VISTLVETPEVSNWLQSNKEMKRGESVKTDVTLATRNQKTPPDPDWNWRRLFIPMTGN